MRILSLEELSRMPQKGYILHGQKCIRSFLTLKLLGINYTKTKISAAMTKELAPEVNMQKR